MKGRSGRRQDGTALAMSAVMRVELFEARGRLRRAARLLAVFWGLLVTSGAGSSAGGPTGAGWRPVAWASHPAEPQVAAAGTAKLGWAVATGGSVWWRRGGGEGVERAVLEDVRDVDFGPGATLWIGTGTGLYRWAPGDRPRRRSLRGDAGDSEIRRIVGSEDGLLIATGAGAYWSTNGRIFQSLVGAGIGRPVDQVAFRRSRVASGAAERLVLWLLGPIGFERIEGLATDAGLRILRRDRLPRPRPRSDALPVDLVAVSDAASLVVLYPDALAVADAQAREPVWQQRRPVLAPGALARRVAWTQGGLFLATDRGLFRADDPAGRFERVGPEPGAQPCFDLEVGSGADSGIVLCRSGAHLLVGGPPPRTPEPVPVPARPAPAADGTGIPADPPVAALRRRALARAGLDADRGSALRAGLARRGWWPELGLRFGADVDRDDRRFFDQSFVSGDYRRLFDRTRDRASGFEATIQLDWSLGDVAYPEDSVDLSRELRQVLALRDDVSDEIHQLYFERAGIRARLASDGPFEPGEPTKLRLRAAELAAGLDAWTGGWLSEWQRDHAPPSLRSSPNHGPEIRGPAHE